MDYKKHIREIPNWPKPGINFKDITTLLENKDIYSNLINDLCKPYENQKIDKITGIDARGFLLAGAMAYKLNTGVCVIRKKGKLPYKSISEDYDLEYGSATIEIHEDTIKPDENIVVVDDLVATGGTLLAACNLIEQLGGNIIGVSYIVDLPFLKGSSKLSKYKNYSLISYGSE